MYDVHNNLAQENILNVFQKVTLMNIELGRPLMKNSMYKIQEMKKMRSFFQDLVSKFVIVSH